MKIKVIKDYDAERFTHAVNDCLNSGWQLFGEPKIETVVEQKSWDGSPYSNTYTVYHQIVKTEKNEN